MSFNVEDVKKVAEDLGVKLCWGEDIKPGDLYLAQRNQGVKLLTCRYVNLEHRWVCPTTAAYPYDLHECVKVVEL